MVFVQYFDESCISEKLIPACGDRSVVILDGRNNLATMKRDAVNFNGVSRPFYKAFQIFKGENFTRSTPITEIESLKQKEK